MPRSRTEPGRARWTFVLTAAFVGGTVLAAGGCASLRGQPGAATESALRLDRVVLYQNGVGYFERRGKLDGQRLRLKVRKDQINDLLKSLAVIDRSSGRVLSVSLPLDPRSWHRAALAALAPGQGRLAQVLDSLRGTRVSVETRRRSVSGRIVMVEERTPLEREDEGPDFEEYTLSLLDGAELHVVALSDVVSLTFEEGDLVMQLDRQLDAIEGEGMFQRVELAVQLGGSDSHDLSLSYVAPAPQWKPTYRVVLDAEQPGRALLQAWAVVDNISGENWDAVALSLTAGAPIAFRYDLHTPREVERPDMSHSAVHKQAAVALGERTFAEDESMPTEVAAEPEAPKEALDGEAAPEDDAAVEGFLSKKESARMRERQSGAASGLQRAGAPAVAPPPPAPAGPSLAQLRDSSAAQARAQQVSGLTRFDLRDRVSLPDGSATMVTLVNQLVPGEQAFMYRPGGSGQGYEANPYRVVRFQNDTDFALEPGPISIYADGNFVGEGLSEAIGSHETATIPFAVEPSITVRSKTDRDRADMRIVRIVRGVLEVESFDRVVTEWSVKSKPHKDAYRVLIRHPRTGARYELVDPPKGTEELVDAYLVPLEVAAGKAEASLRVTERTPSRIQLSIWDGEAIKLLDLLLSARDLDAGQRAKLEPIVALRRQIGRIDSEISGLEEQRAALDQRADETRQSLKAVQKDPKAGALRKRLGERLEQFIGEADALGRRVVELQSQRLELKIELEDKLEAFKLD